MFIFSFLAMGGAVAAAYVGRYTSVDTINQACTTIDEPMLCVYVIGNTVVFGCNIFMVFFALLCTITIIVSFCNFEAVDPTMSLVRVLMSIAAFVQLASLVMGPVSVGKNFFMDGEYVRGVSNCMWMRDWWDDFWTKQYVERLDPLDPAMVRYQWIASLGSALCGFMAVLTAALGNKKDNKTKSKDS